MAGPLGWTPWWSGLGRRGSAWLTTCKKPAACVLLRWMRMRWVALCALLRCRPVELSLWRASSVASVLKWNGVGFTCDAPGVLTGWVEYAPGGVTLIMLLFCFAFNRSFVAHLLPHCTAIRAHQIVADSP